MSDYQERTNRIMERVRHLASFTEVEGNITRTYGRTAFWDAALQVKKWMEDAGMETRLDMLGNVRGRLASRDGTGKTFVVASHIDSVVNAGKFDGPLGVIMGIELLQAVSDSGINIPFNMELIAFCDEEGVRFHTTYLGSKLVAGSFDDSLLEKMDAEGVSVRDLITEQGGDLSKIKQEAIAPQNWLGYFEIHIEQGPVLYQRKIPVAVVTGIAGQVRAELIFKGEAGHAGTVPMKMRRDALSAAAACILHIEETALVNEKILATVGMVQVMNAASNVIPGEVTCTLDLRSADADVLSASKEKLKSALHDIVSSRKIGFEWKDIQETAPVNCSAELIDGLSKAIQAAGHELVLLVSGAGHDAVPISAVSPVSMLFVRCFKGISHNPLEDAEKTDIEAALEVAEKFLQYQIKNQKQ